jgi:hypothetical protein
MTTDTTPPATATAIAETPRLFQEYDLQLVWVRDNAADNLKALSGEDCAILPDPALPKQDAWAAARFESCHVNDGRHQMRYMGEKAGLVSGLAATDSSQRFDLQQEVAKWEQRLEETEKALVEDAVRRIDAANEPPASGWWVLRRRPDGIEAAIDVTLSDALVRHLEHALEAMPTPTQLDALRAGAVACRVPGDVVRFVVWAAADLAGCLRRAADRRVPLDPETQALEAELRQLGSVLLAPAGLTADLEDDEEDDIDEEADDEDFEEEDLDDEEE